VSWDRPFDRPIPLPGQRSARTLRDAGNFIKELPEAERDTPEWRLAIQMLIDAAEDQEPMLFAKMGIDRALNRKTEDGIKRVPLRAPRGGHVESRSKNRKHPAMNRVAESLR